MLTDSGRPALECRNLGVRYGAVKALQRVDLTFAAGQIHAVVGQNGAGKTTFARVCAGIVRASSGEVRVNGNRIAAGDVASARSKGVQLVHQSFALPMSFTVAEAMEFGSTRPAAPVFTRGALNRRWQDHLDRAGVTVPSSRRIRDLPIETRQAVEIARALVCRAEVLILDEPTAVLSPVGIQQLFERVRRLRDQGVTIIVILHKIREVLDIADTVTVLRRGRRIAGPDDVEGLDAGQIGSAIVGSVLTADRLLPQKRKRGSCLSHGETSTSSLTAALDVVEVSTSGNVDDCALDRVSFRVDAGSIVGVAGVEGNGQRTLVNALASLVGVDSGSIRLAGADVTPLALGKRRAAGMRVIPFERNIDGLSLSSPLWKNWSVRKLVAGSPLSPIVPAELRNACRSALAKWSVRFSSIDQNAEELSGGNAQKVVLARELDTDAVFIVAAQPTRGLDVSATTFVWEALREAGRKRAGVLLISSDLDELFGICDRIVVMLSGRIAGEFVPPYDIDAIGRAMTGVPEE